MSRRRPTIVAMIARFPGKAIDGTRVQRGDRIAWCRTTRRVLTSDPARIAALVAGAKLPPSEDGGSATNWDGERHLSLAWQEEQNSARYEAYYGPSESWNDDL